MYLHLRKTEIILYGYNQSINKIKKKSFTVTAEEKDTVHLVQNVAVTFKPQNELKQ